MYFSTVPPKRSSSPLRRVWKESSRRRTSSGSIRSARLVEPTRSAKSTVTTFRSSALGIGAAAGERSAPQAVQYASSTATVSPQAGQDRPRDDPQLPQKSAPGRFSKPHEEHSVADMASLD
jgi:hypothetical protein